MSKFFKSIKKAKKAVDQAAPEPRDLKAITDEYNQLKAQAGEVQYQVYALNSNLEQMNQRLLHLNHEGAARRKLDREAPPKTEEAKSE